MGDWIFNRRGFIKTALAGAVLIAARPSFATQLIEDPYQGPIEGDEAAVEGPDLQEEVNRLQQFTHPGRLKLYNNRTRERINVTYRDPSGQYDPAALSSINYLLRCHYADEVIDIDTRVIEYLSAVDLRLGGGNEIHVISGYRSPEYNKLLRRRSRRVAKHSLHQTGQAIDLRIPGLRLKAIKRAALALKFGGIGYYPRSGFIHLDSGRFRTW